MWHSLPRFDRSAMGTTNCGRAGLFEAAVRARRGPSVVGRKPHTKRLHYCTDIPLAYSSRPDTEDDSGGDECGGGRQGDGNAYTRDDSRALSSSP